ncbi:mediator of RNA polymerase II transcription subunit 28 [Drosophila sechellia]|uniref:Mediator of RNA polymerase II transcription subunit 28 n=2 Tax=melanogaster subgroup TaxID=32351 RepID=B4IC98_DROSE|nr:mediator of RNA polymerase II transcription subunit 28 [Drosophila sechellia]XP_033162963.1 mediator of RNA polymerase II transcription subunit 28 [Drosophila mauritiana]EDW44994.1 GM10244 [Drosophila sechellia]
MASNESGGGNLMDEFEEAFQSCLLTLTKQEPNSGTNKEEIDLEVQKTTNRFIDVARQMEAFFLQKRFLVSTLKPYMLIKDENQDLSIEIQRKEALLQKHYNRLEEWKACLSDIQQGVHSRPTPPIGAGMLQGPGGGMPPMGGTPPRPGMMPGMPPGAMQPGGPMQPSPQHMLQAQQMQQLRMMGRQMPPK